MNGTPREQAAARALYGWMLRERDWPLSALDDVPDLVQDLYLDAARTVIAAVEAVE